MKKIIFIAFISLMALSCSSDNSNKPKTKTLYLSKVFKDGVLESSYSYYNDKKLKEETIYYANGSSKTFNYTYSNGKITSTHETGKTITYKSNNTVRVDKFDIDGNLIGYKVYSDLDSECGFLLFELFTGTGDLRSYSQSEIIDENCSKEGTSYNGAGEKTGSYANIYDGKKFAREFNGSFSLFEKENVGNRKEYYSYDKDGNLKYSYKSTFEYNKDSYPTSETRVDYNGTTINYTYEYK